MTEAKHTPWIGDFRNIHDASGLVVAQANTVDTRNLILKAVNSYDSHLSTIAEMKKALEWQPIETAPKDRLVDIWLSGGVRWCDCYYDRICDEWRTSRPSGHLLFVKASHVQYWREQPAAPVSETQS